LTEPTTLVEASNAVWNFLTAITVFYVGRQLRNLLREFRQVRDEVKEVTFPNAYPDRPADG
jgi:hypothetical protein